MRHVSVEEKISVILIIDQLVKFLKNTFSDTLTIKFADSSPIFVEQRDIYDEIIIQAVIANVIKDE